MVSGFEFGLLRGPKGLERIQCYSRHVETLLCSLKYPDAVERKVYINHAQKFRFNFQENVRHLHYTIYFVNIHILPVYCEDHTGHINTLCA